MKKLLYPAVVAVVLSLAAPVPAQAQELSFIRESHYQLNYGDMLTWNEIYLEHIAPILTAMTEAGTIQGFAAWQHDTGGEYNWRFAMRYYDFESIQTALDDFESRMEGAMPAEAMAKLQSLMGAHTDQIWEVLEVNMAEGTPSSHMYAADFFVNPMDLPEWTSMFEQMWKPVLEQAMADGMLVGYVTLGHVHGGPANWKLLLLHSEWDNIDDVWNATMAGFGENLADMFGMVQSHHDNIWVPVQPGG